MRIFIGIVLWVSMLSGVFAQKSSKASKSTEETTFEVWGNCNMCKKTIETAARIPGVRSAVWNKNTHKMVVKYQPEKTDPKKVQQAIAKSGYDTELFYADDESYKNLHSCCQYKRKPKE